ncbi:MAG: TetR/AcrR family transcriptional regulator [Eubacteriales bacterium]
MKVNDHRTRISKMLIQEAFVSLALEKPFATITIKELCVEAGINRGTFYNNYKDLHDLLEQLEEELLLSIKNALDSTDAEYFTPYTIITKIFKLVHTDKELYYVILGPNGDKTFFQRILNLGKAHYLNSYSKYDGILSLQKMDIHFTFVSSGCCALLEKWLAGDLDMSVEEIARHMEAIITTGIAYLTNDSL